jgi:hypothetical protein
MQYVSQYLHGAIWMLGSASGRVRDDRQTRLLHRIALPMLALVVACVTSSPAQEPSTSPAPEASASPTQAASAPPAQGASASPAQEASASPAQEASASPTQAASADALRRDVQTLAAEAFEGRGLGTEGLDRALEYLEGRFREVGLRPLGTKGYRQSFSGPEGVTLVNLVGVIGDPSVERHVVMGAHYDHLGYGKSGEANHGTLHPGADDNASGVAALLECARKLSEEGSASPVVVIAFAAEEQGLLGSAHYVKQPALPLESCTGMINLDTVGRLFDGSLTIFGSSTASELGHVLRGVNYGFRFQLDLPEQDPGGSDQVSFVQRGVPALQIFSGAHADYHRPGDTPDKIDFAGLERIAAFASELVLYLADRNEALTFLPPGAEKAAAQAPPSRGGGRRVSFGSIPDFNHEGAGVLLSGVIPGSPAAKAGLQEGDLLVEFAGVGVEDLRSFSDILKGLSPGDQVDVVFERGGERHTTTVTVVERK